MFRRLFTLLSAASLVLGVAACVLWVRGRWVNDLLVLTTPTGQFVASFRGDRLVLWRSHAFGGARLSPTGLRHVGWVGERKGATPMARDLPVAVSLPVGGGDAGVVTRKVGVLPYMLVMVVGCVAPATYGLRRGWRGRPPPGLCPACGYDLRATPDRCPESL
jgi:hypothetical protein